MFNFFHKSFGTGAVVEPFDSRDYIYEKILGAAEPVDWEKGYDIEKETGFKIPQKNQGQSGSCVGQAIAYYVGVLNGAEIGRYDEISAKAIYSQIELGMPQGGAYIRSGMKLAVDWGSILEEMVWSYRDNQPPTEQFMKDKTWKCEWIDVTARVLRAKEYRLIQDCTSIDLVAMAIKQNCGMVLGVAGENNGTWLTLEPKPPVNPLVGGVWGHALYFGKFGKDKLGKYIATPNSWGFLGKDELHPDGWQKIREDYFLKKAVFDPWTLVDKPNYDPTKPTVVKDAESTAVGVWYPAKNPAELKEMCEKNNMPVPLKPDGYFDWNRWVKGIVKFNR